MGLLQRQTGHGISSAKGKMPDGSWAPQTWLPRSARPISRFSLSIVHPGHLSMFPNTFFSSRFRSLGVSGLMVTKGPAPFLRMLIRHVPWEQPPHGSLWPERSSETRQQRRQETRTFRVLNTVFHPNIWALGDPVKQSGDSTWGHASDDDVQRGTYLC